MSSLLQNSFLQSKLKTTFKTILGLVVFSVGASLGYAKSTLQSSLTNPNPTSSPNPLKPYISESHLNNTITLTKKPAVIYYYQPSTFYHYIVRHGFLKCAYRCQDRADFYMVNLTKNLEKVVAEIQHQFPIRDYLLEIRFGKEDCQVVDGGGERVVRNVYRREFFNHDYKKSGGVEDFLQENGILQYTDPMQSFFRLTKNCLFEPIKQQAQP